MASSCTTLPRPPFCTSRVMLLYANYFWVLRSILNYGESCSALSHVTTKVGGAEIWRIAENGYLSGTPKNASEEWNSEWFYIDDVVLLDPIRRALPEFASVPLKKRHSWRPRSPEEEDSAEVRQLLSKIRTLAQSGLSIVEVMATSIVRGVQPLQYRGLPMWHYNGEDDASL